MVIKECICIHVLFFSFCLFCLSVELLQNYQIQPPGEPFWPRFYKPAPALPAWLLSIFIPLHPVFAFACGTVTNMLAFDCTGLQLASPKSAFVHGVGAGICVCGCVCVRFESPWSLLSALCGPCPCDAAAVPLFSAPSRCFYESNILSHPAYVICNF